MGTNAQAPRVFAEPPAESLDVTAAIDLSLVDAGAVRRSESNISQWRKYLPEDCVHKMIEMRWDVTT
jgi:hypothetical protein